MDRAEATGFGVATAGHLALLGALSLGFANAVRPPIMSDPMEVSFVDEVAIESTAPSAQEPAAKLAEREGPVADSAPPLPAPEPELIPQPKLVPPPPAPIPAPKPRAIERPQPKPVPAKAKAEPRKAAPPKAPAAKPVAKKAVAKEPAAKTAPARAKQAAKASGRLDGLLSGLSDRPSQSRATAPSAKTASAAVKSSLGAEVRRQLKPHWKAPTGADAELLRTELSITLAPNGTVTNVEVLRTSGETASNRPQVRLHQEQAVKAARLASPFTLPPEYYDAWKLLSPIGFDKRLSQ